MDVLFMAFFVINFCLIMGDYWIGSEDHRIRVNEIGKDKRATLPALVNLMQEVAWNNATKLNYSVYDLMEHGVTWVVNRMQIHFKRYPDQQELVTVQSWPSGMDRFYTYRDYRIMSSDKEEIVRATSAWLVMDIEKRELVSVPSFIREGLDFSQEYERMDLDKSKLLPVENPNTSYETTVGRYNMDQNGHVYNTYYFQWILESMADEILDNYSVDYIDIQFKGESMYGDRIVSNTEDLPEKNFLHQITNGPTGSELIRSKTKWSAKSN